MQPPHTDQEIQEMLKAVGLSSLEELFSDIPVKARLTRPLSLPPAMSEGELRKLLGAWSKKNVTLDEQISFLGAGVYHHEIPAIVKTLISRGEFSTCYTPYQAEASQGTLQGIYEFQTMISKLMGMDVSNASHYDGATALAESAFLAVDATGEKNLLLSRGVHPQYRHVLNTYLQGKNIPVTEIHLEEGVTSPSEVRSAFSRKKQAALILQAPNFFGSVEPMEKLAEVCRENNALLIVASLEPLAFGMLKPPGEQGASLVAGEGQSLGIPLSFGGPHVGYIAAKKEFLRRLPGRIVGLTQDRKGNQAFALTLQTREQHIRREKAASNICTNQSLCAIANAVYLAALGKQGIQEVSRHCYQKTHYAFREWTKEGLTPLFSSPFYHEFPLRLPVPVSSFLEKMKHENILPGYPLADEYPEYPDSILFTLTEKNTQEEILRFAQAVRKIAKEKVGCR